MVMGRPVPGIQEAHPHTRDFNGPLVTSLPLNNLRNGTASNRLFVLRAQSIWSERNEQRTFQSDNQESLWSCNTSNTRYQRQRKYLYAKNVDLHPHCVGNGCFDDADAKKNEINTPSPAMSPNISRNILLCIMSQFSSQPGAEWGEDDWSTKPQSDKG